MVANRRIRAPLQVVAVVVLAGVVTWGVEFAIGYWQSRAEIHAQVESIAADLGATIGEPLGPEAIQRATNDVLVRFGRGEEVDGLTVVATLVGETLERDDGSLAEPPAEAPTELDAITGWLRSSAAAGSTIDRVGRSGGIELGTTGTYGLWLVELLIVVGIATSMALKQARAPFCESCGRWYPDDGPRLVAAGTERQPEVLAAVEQGDGNALAAMVPERRPRGGVIALDVRSCPGCDDGAHWVRVLRIEPDGKGKKVKEKTLRQGLVPAAEARSIVAGLQRPADEPVAGESPSLVTNGG
jgi:hypothetical protein